MKVKKPPSYLDLLEEVKDRFDEYLDMDCDPKGFILSLLHQEREKTFRLEQRLDYFERRHLHERKSL